MKLSATRLAAIALALPIAAPANDWPAWRGPEGDGSITGNLPPLTEATEPAWRLPLPGRGCSTPINVGDRIFVTTPIDGEDGVLALNLEGEEQWRRTIGKAVPGLGQKVGSSCNSSPATDGERVFAYFKSGNLAAFTPDGEKLWQFNVFEKYGPNTLKWDVGTSPVVADGKLVLAVMQTEGDSFLVSLDPATGEELWKTARDFETGRESGDAYSTPLVEEIDGVETIVCWGADHLTGHDAATGKLLWTCGGFNPKRAGAWRVIASPAETAGIAVVPYARGEAVAAVKLGGSGDITASAMLWDKKGLGSDTATPAARDGRVYLLTDRGRDRGTITCLDAASGDVVWTAELPKAPQTFYASPLLVDKVLYCAREDGTIFSAEVTDEGLGELRTKSIGEGLIASPAVIGGRLLVRGEKHLIAFGD